MKKNLTKIVVFTCALALSLAPISAAAIPASSGQGEKAGVLESSQETPDAEHTENVLGLESISKEDKPSYTAPENTQNANVSFSFTEAATSAYFSKFTYPLTLSLKEVDTGVKATLIIKSKGQILEVEKGDYAVISLKDNGKIPLSVVGDTLHIYSNTEYPVRFAANNMLKTLTDFLADNLFLACFFVFAALFYKKIIILRFASDAVRR